MDNEKEDYREKIIEMVGRIEDIDIMKYIYIIILDIEKENNENGKRE